MVSLETWGPTGREVGGSGSNRVRSRRFAGAEITVLEMSDQLSKRTLLVVLLVVGLVVSFLGAALFGGPAFRLSLARFTGAASFGFRSAHLTNAGLLVAERATLGQGGQATRVSLVTSGCARSASSATTGGCSG